MIPLKVRAPPEAVWGCRLFFFFLCGLNVWEWFRSKVNIIIAASQIIIDLLQFINGVKS